MKRSTIALLSIIMVLAVLSGCGRKSGKPDRMSEAYYQFGLKVLEITDEYLSMSASARDVYYRLDDLEKNAGLPEAFGTGMTGDSTVSTSVSLLMVRLNGVSLTADYNDVLESRNSLAEKLNEPAFGK